MTNILDTVKAALNGPMVMPTVVRQWLRALVAEVERLREGQHYWPDTEQVKTLKAELARAESDLAALRQRHAAAVEAAYREGWIAYEDDRDQDAAWLASEAKARLT